RPGRGRRAERPAGPRGDRRPAVRHHGHPGLRARGVQPAAWTPRSGALTCPEDVMKRPHYYPALGAVALLGTVAWGLASRAKAAASLEKDTLEMAVPTVSVAPPKRSDGTTEVVLPGSIQAFTDAPIYARTSGYLRRWHADIGTRVTA